ncbi:uncharacterized protein FA14DRAFT_87954 [Meira miltonrushii]|uniref:Secreted protein n=1 Tax=Meira miltonrushii TaxID=1280837 RepID=A0A316V869_9BASI|nr:uncharacterized protein FA14DRAFT_87954 [Meira miltonrushii]PWN32403.1 hypothetical protein FA14DRAFT_87954 [Meira miltonrushii]
MDSVWYFVLSLAPLPSVETAPLTLEEFCVESCVKSCTFTFLPSFCPSSFSGPLVWIYLQFLFFSRDCRCLLVRAR